MKKFLLTLFMVLFFISTCSSLCEEGQIDINNASLEELKGIIHVGPKVAGYIIEARPFNSLDELVNISYISSGYLDEIIEQGLACVNGYEEEEVVEENFTVSENVNNTENGFVDEKELDSNNKQTQPITPKVIKLNPTPKNIKSEDNTESLDKTEYAKYGFIVFYVLIGILLILKNKKKNKKSIV